MILVEEKDLESLAGTNRRQRQMEWLRQNRIKYLVGYDGKPKVLTSHLESIMGNAKIANRTPTEPNFDILRRSIHA